MENRGSDELLTPAELQDYLKCGSSFVDYMLRIGEIPSIKVGRLRRVRRSSLERYLDQREKQNTGARIAARTRNGGS
jgi:excisionase family DNA binding protein